MLIQDKTKLLELIGLMTSLILLSSVFIFAQTETTMQEKPILKSVVEYVYKVPTKQEPIYKDIQIPNNFPCYDNVSLWNECTFYTSERQLIGYKEISEKPIYQGIKVNNLILEKPSNILTKENLAVIWHYPQGDRNMVEFGRCRQYEKDRGLCDEIQI